MASIHRRRILVCSGVERWKQSLTQQVRDVEVGVPGGVPAIRTVKPMPMSRGTVKSDV